MEDESKRVDFGLYDESIIRAKMCKLDIVEFTCYNEANKKWTSTSKVHQNETPVVAATGVSSRFIRSSIRLG